ncbi:hypothetical protein GCM10023237_01910 [Streptomyces coeruleoprunus]|uniref:RDD family protein n=1 Tax=Streptomyces coeruleoprunus TaxID=285563 RepID=UPI0031EB1352
MPAPAGEARRVLAVVLDVVLAIWVPYLLVGLNDTSGGAFEQVSKPLLALGGMLATSFLNQVVLTVLVRASVGKLIMGIRVVRATDGSRPGFWRTLRRWLSGLCWLPLQPWYWLRSVFRDFSRGSAPARGTVVDNDDGDLYSADLAGLRHVRRKDLAAPRG